MRGRLATISLLGVTAVWGWTFVVVHDAVAVYGVMPFLAVRFLLAAVATVVFWGRHLNRRSLLVGGGIGIVLALGYLFQTWGLKFTTPTNSGLITGLFVIFAPVVDRLLFGVRMSASRWLAVGLSLVGMTLLTGRVPFDLAFGDILTLICAVWLGIHIALLSRHAPRHDPRALGTAQMLGVGLFFLVLWPASGPVLAPPREVWLAIVITGLFASALAYFVQSAAQQHLTTARTAIILTTEPVFAGLFGYLVAGDRLNPLQAAGALLILLALAVSEAVPHLTGRAKAANRDAGGRR
jgi:drug/metabolite transporter (DMT)-like permease